MRMIALTAVALLALAAPAPAQVRVDRLERLATYLETRVHPERFNMARWGDGDEAADPEFTGCAAGHATAIFADEGFRMDQLRNSGNEACVRFFGVSTSVSYRLFGSDQRTPVEEAREIRAVIAAERLAHSDPPARPICYLAAW